MLTMRTGIRAAFRAIAAASVIAAIAAMPSGCGKKEEKAQQPPPAEALSRAPAQALPFAITTFDKRQVSLEGLSGRLVVVNFFASWCGPCKLEAPALEQAWQEFRGKGVEFVGIAVDDTEEGARRFVKDFGLTFPAGMDSTGKVMRDYAIYGIPKTYIVGRDGAVLYEHSGTITFDTLSSMLRRHLGPSSPD